MNREKRRKLLALLQIQNSILTILLVLKCLKKKRLRRWDTKPYLHPHLREQFGAYQTVCFLFKLSDHEEFYKMMRLNVEDFDELHNLTQNQLKKQTFIKQPISSEIRLAATLVYLGNGGNIATIATFFRTGRSTMYEIISTTCLILQNILMPLYIPFPNEVQWLQIANNFYDKWNFPNCLGALDGKHIRIKQPSYGGSLFYNYKKFNSINLMALSDAYSRITWFSTGDFGSYSDSSVFSATEFKEKLESGQLQIPLAQPLPNSDVHMPFVIVADEIFPLGQHLMKPYNRKCIRTNQERIFNYRLSRARFTIECAFGILTSKWRVLQGTLAFDLRTTISVISACICLHNFFITRNKITLEENLPQRLERQEQVIEEKFLPAIIREQFAEYFSSAAGSVPWQNNYI